MITWAWGSYPQDRCRDWWEVTTNPMCNNFERVFDFVQLRYGRVLHHFITVGETWIYLITWEIELQSEWWILPDESAPMKAKLCLSTNKGKGKGSRNSTKRSVELKGVYVEQNVFCVFHWKIPNLWTHPRKNRWGCWCLPSNFIKSCSAIKG